MTLKHVFYCLSDFIFNEGEYAKKHLNLEALKTRNSYSLDFHDVADWSLKEAYAAGLKAKR